MSNRRKRGENSSTGQDLRRKRLKGKHGVEVNINGLDANETRHHTEDYENESVVLRRGDTFSFDLLFEGIPFKDALEMYLNFHIQSSNDKLNDRIKKCEIVQNVDNSSWQMRIIDKNQSECRITLEVNIPVNAIVGRYSFGVVVPSVSLNPIDEFEAIILFNAWNKDDEVYLTYNEEREEYVLNDTGLVYAGIYNYLHPRPKYWNFAQFEENILDCVLDLLDKYKRSPSSLLSMVKNRSSAVCVSRMLSAVLNNEDENGVLEGNWSGDYSDGKSPTSWNGSEEIFARYYATKKPVKYGQCWVFSGILTTALRALGIPARSVTNYDSAHDTDNTMTIDAFYDEEGNRIDELCDDSVWNFHVWNEVWTKRRDLPDDSYDGWQALDATPQELSTGLFQLGPAPLKAIKEGEVYVGFDTNFVFGEVNADRVSWVAKKDEYGDYNIQKMKSRKTMSIGWHISTKKVGTYDREDITHLYKYEEGSAEERKAFKTAYSFGKGPKTWEGELNIKQPGKDLTIDLAVKPSDSDTLYNGESFTCMADVKNTSQHDITIDLVGVINSVQYNGENKALIKRHKMKALSIKPGKQTSCKILVDPEEYLEKLSDYNAFKFVLVVKVLGAEDNYVDDLIFNLLNPESIEINAHGPLKVGRRSCIEVLFHNTFKTKLTQLQFTAEGPKLMKPTTKKYKAALYQERTKKVRFYVKPKKAGTRLFMVDVDSYEIKDMKASRTFMVLP